MNRSPGADAGARRLPADEIRLHGARVDASEHAGSELLMLLASLISPMTMARPIRRWAPWHEVQDRPRYGTGSCRRSLAAANSNQASSGRWDEL